jgi:predicted acetyltransferase
MMANVEAKMDHRQQEMKSHMYSLASRIEDNNEKFQVLQGTLFSRMDIHQVKMEVAIHSIPSEF